MQSKGYQRETDCENSDEHIYSKVVRAGRRTYFFDVKATKNNDYFLTLTESCKRITKTGEQIFEKHKIFLYKEDFCKFMCGLDEVVNYVKQNKPEFFAQEPEAGDPAIIYDYTDEEFEKL